MRLYLVLPMIPLITLLGSCGPATNEKTIRTGDAGERVTMRTGTGIAPPRSLPKFAAIYPGAVIESSVDGVAAASEGGGRGGMVSFATRDDVEKVAAFYRDKLADARLTEKSETNLSGAIILSGLDPEEREKSMQVSIAPAGDDTGARVTLIYSLGSG